MKPKNSSVFREIQKFPGKTLWWLRIFSLLILIIAFVMPFYVQIIKGIKYGNNPASDPELIIICLSGLIIIGLTWLWFEWAKLNTEIDNRGIKCKYLPFPRRLLYLHWDIIEKYYIISASQGYKLLGKRSGKNSFYLNSKKCLLLKLKTGEKILIGTQKDEELSVFLNNIKRSRSFIE